MTNRPLFVHIATGIIITDITTTGLLCTAKKDNWTWQGTIDEFVREFRRLDIDTKPLGPSEIK